MLKTVVVVCEGTETEPEYIEALRDTPEVREVAAVELRLEARNLGEVPLTLVRRALDLQAASRDTGDEVDEFWCVFDVEWPQNHPNLQQAVALAKTNDIKLAISNPTFELWLALHFRDVRRFLDNNQARRLRRDCDGKPDKHLDGETYMARRHTAVQHAEGLETMHQGNGTTFPHDNPSSGMYRLLRSISAVQPSPDASSAGGQRRVPTNTSPSTARSAARKRRNR